MEIVFEIEKHIYKSTAMEEIIKDTIRFFNGTPIHKLSPAVRFNGAGVYVVYYIGQNKYYQELYQQNRLEFAQPIYVGKAVPSGWRQAKSINDTTTTELYKRLKEHEKSINQVQNLEKEDFYCRFIVLEDSASYLIGTLEAALIRYYRPIWNTQIDGFGNHDPGSGRYNQAKSEWDILHSGRTWAEKCVGKSASIEQIEAKILEYFKNNKDVE
jgi:hypothetical protein